MEIKKKSSLSIESLEKAFNFLEGFSVENCTEQEKAGIIKAFEMCYELSWKMLKKVLFIKGVNANTPKDVFREAAVAGLIADPKPWFKFLEERNKTVHTYSLETIEEILLKIIPEFKLEVEKVIMVLRDAI